MSLLGAKLKRPAVPVPKKTGPLPYIPPSRPERAAKDDWRRTPADDWYAEHEARERKAGEASELERATGKRIRRAERRLREVR